MTWQQWTRSQRLQSRRRCSTMCDAAPQHCHCRHRHRRRRRRHGTLCGSHLVDPMLLQSSSPTIHTHHTQQSTMNGEIERECVCRCKTCEHTLQQKHTINSHTHTLCHKAPPLELAPHSLSRSHHARTHLPLLAQLSAPLLVVARQLPQPLVRVVLRLHRLTLSLL